MYYRDLPLKGFNPPWLSKLPVKLINKYAKYYNIDSVVLGAIVMVESAGNPYAIRYESGYSYTFSVRRLSDAISCSADTMELMQKTSWGLMQVMGSVAYELGLGAEKDPNNRWPTSLLNEERGMAYGCKHLRNKIDSYGADPATIYAAYNGGSPRYSKSGAFFQNQSHVDKFMGFYTELGGD